MLFITKVFIKIDSMYLKSIKKSNTTLFTSLSIIPVILKKSVCVMTALFLFFPMALYGAGENDSSQKKTRENTAIYTTDENEILSENSLNAVTIALNSSKSEKSKDENNNQKKKKGLTTPELIDQYSQTINKQTVFEHIVISMMYGIVTGGTIGAAGGLAVYDSNNMTNSMDNIQLFALGGIAVGGISGVTIAILERLGDGPYTLGKGVFRNSWYGAIGGIMLGAIAGSITYITSGNTDHILNGVGYGAMGGLAAGTLLQLIWPKSWDYQVAFLPSPEVSYLQISWRFN